MTTFLAWLANSWLMKSLLGVVVDRIVALIQRYIKSRDQASKSHDERVAQANQDAKKVEELKPDASAEEVDAAIDDQLNHF